MILLFSFNPVPGKDYAKLEQVLKSTGTWWHHLEGVWLVRTPESPQVWYEKVKPYLDSDESFLVIEVHGNYQGWLPKQAWEWLNGQFR